MNVDRVAVLSYTIRELPGIYMIVFCKVVLTADPSGFPDAHHTSYGRDVGVFKTREVLLKKVHEAPDPGSAFDLGIGQVVDICCIGLFTDSRAVKRQLIGSSWNAEKLEVVSVGYFQNTFFISLFKERCQSVAVAVDMSPMEKGWGRGVAVKAVKKLVELIEIDVGNAEAQTQGLVLSGF